MSRRTRKVTSSTMLELWRPPFNAGEPIGCLATTYTFTPGLFDESCLGRFLDIESEPNREDLAFLVEREHRLGSVYAGVLVDHTQAGVKHSLRWDVLPVRVRAGKQHAKVTLLAWSHHVRVIVGSANLTEQGYRFNHEVAATVDLSPTEADTNLLGEALVFLRDLLAFVPSARDNTPEVRRAEDYLSSVEKQVKPWKRSRGRTTVRQGLACTLPATSTLKDPRSSLNEAVAACRRRGRSPHEARIASPFFDVNDDSGRVIAALCKSMARGRDRKVRFCVPAIHDQDETEISRLAAPRAIEKIPPHYGTRVSVAALPQRDGDKNPRPWHAKMLALQGDRYTALMIGSSNFTCAGMGAASHRNIEANLVTVVERVAYGRQVGELEAIWSRMDPVDNLNGVEWLGRRPEDDEEESATVPSLPAGFLSATYCGGAARVIVLRLDPAGLPSAWSIIACGPDQRRLLDASTWTATGSQPVVTQEWSPPHPPDRLLVSWNDQKAFLPLNVEDGQELPPPEQLEQMSADDMLRILAAADPSGAFRAWARRRRRFDTFDAELDSADPIDLDPLRRHDLEATYLHRVRRRARVLSQLRANLQRPVWSRQALEWRLRGIIGIDALAERLVRDTSAGKTAEPLLALADFLIVLREVDYTPSEGCLSKQEFEAAFRPFLHDLAGRLDAKVNAQQSVFSPELLAFWRRVVTQWQ